jgi:hypothetical protein
MSSTEKPHPASLHPLRFATFTSKLPNVMISEMKKFETRDVECKYNPSRILKTSHTLTQE